MTARAKHKRDTVFSLRRRYAGVVLFSSGVLTSIQSMVEPRDFLLENLPLIQQIVSAVCRRRGMDREATEEFAAEVRLRLVRDDYAIIRRFAGRSSFKTYMTSVVTRLLLDYRNHLWGKWHASSEAVRLGDMAVEIEQLLHRDDHSADEVRVLLAPKYPELTLAEIERIAVRLPPRTRRKRVEIEEARFVAENGHAGSAERSETATRVSRIVNAYIDTLAEDEQLVLKLRFDSDMTVAQIARALHGNQQKLYRCLYKHFQELHSALSRAGVSAEEVAELIGTDTTQLDFRFKNRAPRPSVDEESSVAGRSKEMPR